MIIHDNASAKRNARLKRKKQGKKWWQSRFRIMSVVSVIFICGAVLGGGFSLEKAIRRGKLQKIVDKNFKQINTRLTEAKRHFKSLFSANPEKVLFDIKMKDYLKLSEKRKEALARGFLLADKDDYVQASIHYNGRDFPVRLRLKGDLPDHWAGEKWSFRIETRKDTKFKGMREFAIQSPATRNYIYDWAFLKNLMLEDVLGVRYEFVDVWINGKHKGIYALEESFSKELIEAQNRREGVIARFDESTLWRQWNNWAPYYLAGGSTLGLPSDPSKFILQPQNWIRSRLNVFRNNKVNESEDLSRQRDIALGLLDSFRQGKIKASDAFDAPVLAKYLALVSLWGGGHNFDWPNLRFYFNPVTLKFEPIGFDVLCGHKQETEGNINAILGKPSSGFPFGWIDWLAYVLNDEIVGELYVKELLRVTSPEYISWLKSKIGPELSQKLSYLWREYPDIDLDWRIVESNAAFLRKLLNPVKQVDVYADNKVHIEPASGRGRLHIAIANLLTLPVEVVSAAIDGQDTAIVQAGAKKEEDSTSIVLGSLNPFEKINFFDLYIAVPEKFIEGGKLKTGSVVSLRTRLLGSNNERITDVEFLPKPEFISGIPRSPGPEALIKEYDFLVYYRDSREFFVKPGTWRVKGDIVLPKNTSLNIPPDTVLEFDENAALVCFGPVFLNGTIERPIKLSPCNGSWPGMIVLDPSGRTSLMKGVTVSGTRSISREGWILTGGITFYQSAVELQNVKIQNSFSEDGLNIIRSKFLMSNMEFSKCSSDAFDSDFSRGIIVNSVFEDIQGDAVDVSGTEIELKNIVIKGAKDKGISVGEKSSLKAENIRIERSGIGIASKDLSSAAVFKCSINDCHISLAAFQKKPEYGPADLSVSDVSFSGVGRETLLEEGSSLSVNGEDIKGGRVDLKEIY